MKVEIFKNKDEIYDWLEIAKFSNFEENEKIENIHIDKEFERAIIESVEFTNSLPQDFKITYGSSILLCLRNDNDEIVGTASIRRDYHKGDAVQVNDVAIHPDHRRKGYGNLLIEGVRKLAKEHSNGHFLTLTTGGSHGFYESIGMTLAGVLDFGVKKRYFFYKKLN